MTSLLELCQSHTTCSSIILTLAGTVHAAAGRHAAATARQFLQLTGKGNDFLFVFPHQLEAEMESKLDLRRQMGTSVFFDARSCCRHQQFATASERKKENKTQSEKHKTFIQEAPSPG